MRRKRGKYKVCGRLGYNARRRIWFGKKRKWEKAKRFQESLGRKGKEDSVNPTKALTNQERLEGGRGESRGKGRKTQRRRKDTYRNKLNRRTGRKRRYGRIPRKTLQRGRRKERRRQKGWKNQVNRRYRKGEWTREKRGRDQNQRARNQRNQSRFGTQERRVDVRRWRSGRVQTIQRARDRIEHGKVEWREGRTGVERGKVKWEGKRRKPGQGRRVEETTWKQRKEEGREKYKKREEEGKGRKYERKAVQYLEVDYVTGRRRVHRRPKSGEIWMPKGRQRSRRR